ncbi:MAG: ATP-binding protein, partial [Bacteroidota bacterium]
EDTKGNFWVGTKGNHVHLLHRETGRFTYKEKLSDFRIKDSISQVRSFFQDPNDGDIWVLSYGSGLRKYRLKDDRLMGEIFSMDEDRKSMFPLNQAWQIYQSREGTLWICSGDIGEKVYKSNRLMPHLGTVFLGDHIVSASITEESRNMWFGRRLNGLNYVNWEEDDMPFTWTNLPDRPLFGSYSMANDDDSNALFDNITSLLEDEEEIVWFAKGEAGEGLFRFDWRNGKLHNFLPSAMSPSIPASDTLLHLVASADNTSIWTVSEGGLLHRFDKQTEQFDRFSSRNLPGLPVSPRLLYGDDYEALWIAGFTEEGELALASLRSKTMLVKTQTLLSLDRGNLPRLTGLQRSTDRTFWLGVETHLVSLAEDGAVATYALPEELGEMRSFLFDDQENIWMATTRGIAIFNVGDEDFFLFPEDYDYLAQPYQFRSALVHSPEEMLFCGQGGCTYVNATTIERYYNSTRKQTSLSSDLIRLTAFLLNGKEVTEGPMSAESITHSRALSLNYDQNNFSFELSLLDFDRPTDNDFYYKLEGYDSYWRQTGDRNTIYFAQVPPGEYTLLVKGYNSVGAFGKAHPVKITVLPPWWLTWWAYVVYALLGLALVYAIYRFQLSRQIAKSEAQRLQDLNVAKSRLYTNITHEFRTPLTVILGMTEQLERSATAAQREPVEMIERNGRSLLSLVNQMLDLAKLESGQMDLHLQQSDLISYLKYLVESFHSFAESRGVKIHFLSDLETQVMDFDAGKIQQVISNLLSNAIKFTPTGGDIYLLANTTGGAPAAELLIQVRDTGAGISPERLPYIFERFYQADDSHTREQSGTGIGLALVAELVKL